MAQYNFTDTPHKAQNAFDESLFSFRKAPNVLDGDYGRLLLNKVVGGSVGWNQLQQKITSVTGGPIDGVTATVDSNGFINLSGTAQADGELTANPYISSVPANHVVLYMIDGTPDYKWGRGGFNLTQTGKYMLQKHTANFSCTFKISIKNGTTYNSKTRVDIIDLTLFNSTIADYVYNLEQSTAGSGVAWLKTYFPSMFSGYKAHDTGSLQSVSVGSHVMRGFNAWDEEWEVGSLNSDTGLNSSSTVQIRSKGFTKVLPNTEYYLTIPAASYMFYYDADKNYIGEKTYISSTHTFTTPANAFYVRFRVSATYGTTYNNDICINISKTTGTPKNGDYVAYESSEYTLPHNELRGIIKLNNGIPYYDGDVLEPSGVITRKRKQITLDGVTSARKFTSTGTSGSTRYFTLNHGFIGINSTASEAHVISDQFIGKGAVEAGNCYVTGSGGTLVVILRDQTIDNTTSANTWLANNLPEFSLELATPTTENVSSYTNPQVCYSDGTEEFTDYLLSQGSRDISLPVQSQSMYYEAVPLPSEALSINGTFIEDVIDGYRTLNVTGRETMAQEIKEAEVGKHDGAFFQFRRYPTRDIVVKYQIIAESNEAYREAFIKLNSMLNFEEGVLIFNDETDKYFVGTPTDVELPEPGLNCAVGEFTLHCEDPFKYSVQEKGVDMQSDANGYFFGLDYKGTHKSYPRIETDFYKTDTEDDDNGECSFISFMKTDGKILLFGDPENTDANRAPVRIFQRASSAPAVPSSQVTFSFESQTVTNPSALGSWSTTIPSGESTLWTTMAIAESTATNAYINQADWGTVEQYANQDDSALYSINSKTEVNKKFTSQGTAWASNSGKIYNGWLETGTPGIVTPPSGNKYITASGYGSGSDWHGPSVTRTKSDDIRDFLFAFNYGFYQGTGDQASKQTGLLQAVLWNSTQSKIIAALSFWKNSGNSKGSIRMIVGGKAVKTLSEVPFGILTQMVTTDANACSIKKIGSTVIFNVKGTEYRFVDESIKETATDKVTFYFAKKGTTTAMDEIGVHGAQLIKYYQPVSPNPFTSNDELRIDTKNTAVQLNGLDAQGLGALANDWEGFYLKPGINLIGVVWSEYVPPTYIPTCRLYYREVFL